MIPPVLFFDHFRLIWYNLYMEITKNRTINNYNLDLYISNNNKYNIPSLKKDDIIPKKLIGFNYAKSSKEKNIGIHFYLDDYQFERIWNSPEKYISILRQYECVLTPDFSLYTDMPLAMQIWNTYRSRIIGVYLQQCGIKVIPTISWADKDSYDFAFEGIEEGSIVSISTIGVTSEEERELYTNGVAQMIKQIKPKTILIYGKKIDYDFKDINVIYYKNDRLERVRSL